MLKVAVDSNTKVATVKWLSYTFSSPSHTWQLSPLQLLLSKRKNCTESLRKVATCATGLKVLNVCKLVKNVAKSRFSNLKIISQSENSISSRDLYLHEPQRWCSK